MDANIFAAQHSLRIPARLGPRTLRTTLHKSSPKARASSPVVCSPKKSAQYCALLDNHAINYFIGKGVVLSKNGGKVLSDKTNTERPMFRVRIEATKPSTNRLASSRVSKKSQNEDQLAIAEVDEELLESIVMSDKNSSPTLKSKLTQCKELSRRIEAKDKDFAQKVKILTNMGVKLR